MVAAAYGLPPGSFKLVAFDDGGDFAPQFFEDARSFDDATVVAVTRNRKINGVSFQLQRGARLSGTVKDAATGLRLAAKDVFAYTPTYSDCCHGNRHL
jgi:hypothetical protein